MTSRLFDPGREGILDRTIDMTGDVRAMLVKAGYTFDAADKFVADLGANDNGRSASLAGKTFTAGVFDANDTTLLAGAAEESDALVLFEHTGDDATARLVAYIDDAESGLPFTPAAGQQVNIAWSNGADKIFKL